MAKGTGKPTGKKARSLHARVRRSSIFLALIGLAIGMPIAAKSETAVAPPGASTAQATLVARLGAEKPEAILGEDTRIDLVLEFEGPGADQVELGPLAMSVGQVVDVVRVSSTAFVATYLLPPTSFPQIALGIFSWRLPGQAPRHLLWRCPLRALTSFPFRTKPHATVSVNVGSETFGPVTADAEGRVLLPLAVPPGFARATARAVDGYGNASETTVELDPPPFIRSVVLAEESTTAGRPFTVVAAAVDESGAFADPRTLRVLGPSGEARPRVEGALAFFEVDAPNDVAASPVDLRVLFPDGTEEAGPAVALRAGPPTTLHVVPDRPRLTVGQRATANVAIFARDAFGNLCELRGLTVRRDGADVVPGMDGRVAMLTVETPEVFGTQDRALIDATLGPLRAAATVLFQGERAERLLVTAERDRLAPGEGPLRLWIRATDRHGAPAPARGLDVETRARGGRLTSWHQLSDSAWSAEFEADPVTYPAVAHLTIGVTPELAAHLHLPVTPLPERWTLGLRAGFVTNLGALFAPAVAVDWSAPARWLGPAWRAGLELIFVAYRFDDGPVPPTVPLSTAADLFQWPLLAKLVRRVPLRWGLELRLGAAAGFELALLRIRDKAGQTPDVVGHAIAPVAAGLAEVAFFLPAGEVLLGSRYLLTRIGRTSSGDVVNGNALGLGLDVAFRRRW